MIKIKSELVKFQTNNIKEDASTNGMQLRSKWVPVVLASFGSVDINYVYCLFNCCPDCPDAFDGLPVK